MQEFSQNLIEGFNDGNEKAVALMCKSYFRQVQTRVQMFTGGSPDDQDLAGEAMIRFLERRPRFKTVKNMEKYLDQVTMGVCADDKRKKKTRKLNAFRVHEQLTSTQAKNMENEKKRSICAYLMKLVVDKLPTKTRQVFLMSFIDEMTSRQIATKLNLSLRTVDYHKSEAYNRLRLEIKKGHHDPGEFLITSIWVPLLIVYFYIQKLLA